MPHAPPFTLTPLILSQVAEICGQVGLFDGGDWGSRSPHLRKDRWIQSLHSSLAIENNTLSLNQSAVINGKKVLGLVREIQKVKNAYAAYESLGSLQSINKTIPKEQPNPPETSHSPAANA